ncbi:MAG: 3-deoxy-8-phosphooctulonate synthase [Paludibacteraceae bacterium]|nr:3-deoxy-8-phosphooctulonate synthase [Paludibacteraceae bacterium]
MFLIAGPCAIESRECVLQTAETLNRLCYDLGITLYFKSSFDKANRTSASERGLGMEEGLQILQEVKEQFGLPIVTDVHESYQCAPTAEIADVLQIPAFLSRQTDLLQAAAVTGRVVNVKKGQFMAPWDLGGAISKIEQVALGAAREGRVWLTERGSSFGYGRLVVDMTSLVEMRRFGCPVVFDATHSVQQPSTQAGITGGNREMVPYLMRAALAVGVDGLFIETHPEPEKAISDAANQIRLSDMRTLLQQAIDIEKTITDNR